MFIDQNILNIARFGFSLNIAAVIIATLYRGIATSPPLGGSSQ
jgi:hypothetical protein